MPGANTLESLAVDAERHRAALDEARKLLGTVILGKEPEITLALACLLARGHLLIEDLPGLGKTTLAQALATVLGLDYQRIQFTSDLLPADIIGVSIFNRDTSRFEFNRGPLFSQLVLADEVNRATPKAQSALLEAMQERQVSVDGETHPLPDPFFVVATQNPADQVGTFPLPESQLDRFLMRIELGYPDTESERALIVGNDRQRLLATLSPALSPEALLGLQTAAANLRMNDPLVDYLQALIRFTRESPELDVGLSPRGALALAAAARAHAYVEQHSGVFPDDVQAVFPAVAGHRMKPASGTGRATASDLCRHVLDSVAIP